MEPSDGELLLRYVTEVSQPAFRSLVERYTPMVYSICRRRIGERQLAEDAAQMVFVALAKNAASLEPGPLDGYLAKTAIFISAEIVRKRAVRVKHEQRYQAEIQPVGQADSSEDRLTAVRAALARLRPPYRDAVTLRYLDGLSVEGVAGALNISLETAKKRLMRGLAQVQERLADQGFSMTFSVAMGLMRKLSEPPPAGLADRIFDAVFVKPLANPPKFRWGPRKLLLQPLGSAVVGGTCVLLLFAALMPSVQTGKPIGGAAASSLATVTPAAANASVEQRLARKIPDLKNERNTFDGALWVLSISSGVTIDVDWDAVAAAGVTRKLRFELELKNQTAHQQLLAILDAVAPGKLEYVFVGDHVLVRPHTADRRSNTLNAGG